LKDEDFDREQANIKLQQANEIIKGKCE